MTAAPAAPAARPTTRAPGDAATARAVTTPLTVHHRHGSGGVVTVPWDAGLFPLRGHYPGFPIVPGVLLVETADRAVREVGGVEAAWSGIRTTRFQRPVYPGDVLRAEVEVSSGGEITTAKVALTVAGAAAATVTLTYQDDAPAPVAAVPHARVRPGEPDPDVTGILPHRYPMLLVDRVLHLDPPRTLLAAKAVSAGEWPYEHAGTTTGYPWPLVVESWCQSAGVLAAADRPNPDVLSGQVMLFGGISGITLGAPVRPGDVLVHRVQLDRDLGDVLMMSGSSEVDGRTVMSVDRITMAMRPADALARTSGAGA
ncbi:MAG: hypothetical protein ACFCVG_16025 [Kineosporiaceae bacterium]